MKETQPEIILDGVSYNINNFSQTVQAMIQVRTRWEEDLQRERSAVLKTEQAMKALDDQLSKIVQDELRAKSEAARQAQLDTTKPSEDLYGGVENAA